MVGIDSLPLERFLVPFKQIIDMFEVENFTVRCCNITYRNKLMIDLPNAYGMTIWLTVTTDVIQPTWNLIVLTTLVCEVREILTISLSIFQESLRRFGSRFNRRGKIPLILKLIQILNGLFWGIQGCEQFLQLCFFRPRTYVWTEPEKQ